MFFRSQILAGLKIVNSKFTTLKLKKGENMFRGKVMIHSFEESFDPLAESVRGNENEKHSMCPISNGKNPRRIGARRKPRVYNVICIQ